MIFRYASSTVAATAVTFALFFVMQALIAGRSAQLEKEEKHWALDFVRLKREETIEKKKRRRPEQVEKSEPVPRIATVAENLDAPGLRVMNVDAPKFDPSLSGRPYLAAGSDTDAVPLVRVDARYPSRARARGIEGWVYLRFTVTPKGTTTDIQVLDSDPKGYFERAAEQAVGKYKYKPRIENGVAVARPGIELVLSFELED